MSTPNLIPVTAPVDMSLIQWVECSKCQKWRIIHPLPDGSDEDIPELWFCEMNRDVNHNDCSAPEEEYKAPQEMPLMDLGAMFPIFPVATKTKLAKSTDPDAIRARLKQLTIEELEAAFQNIDIERLLKEEFGENLESARASSLWVSEAARAASSHRNKVSTRTKADAFDAESVKDEIKHLIAEVKNDLPEEITSELTHRYR